MAAYTARQIQQKPVERPRVTVIRGNQSKVRHQLIVGVRPMKIVVTCVLLAIVAGASLCCKAVLTETVNEISQVNQELEVLQSENVRLNMELEAMVSLKNIEEYATEELGLTKLENSQVSYVTLDEGERVVTASGDQGLRVWERIKEGFSLLREKLK